MKLKEGIKLSAFLQQVRLCQGEVWFVTKEGDQLNLKSMLSEFLFLSVALSSNWSQFGFVKCQIPTDQTVLQDYLED